LLHKKEKGANKILDYRKPLRIFCSVTGVHVIVDKYYSAPQVGVLFSGWASPKTLNPPIFEG
jgi:hypothetical protein